MLSKLFALIYSVSFSNSFCKLANALQATLAECLMPSVSIVPASSKCRARASNSSPDLLLSQCNGLSGLCC